MILGLIVFAWGAVFLFVGMNVESQWMTALGGILIGLVVVVALLSGDNA